MRGRRVPPTARRQRVWSGVLRDPGLGAGSGCGTVGRATAGPGGRTEVRASGGVRPSAPPIYINAGQHYSGQRGGAGKHLGTLEGRTAMGIGVRTPEHIIYILVMSMPTQRPG